MCLRELRERAGLTQVELAERSGIHQSHISRIETGFVVRPSFDVVSKLAAALGVPTDDFLPIADSADQAETVEGATC
jgi:transcriptional regulator with XRE-family HTH domain